jgi:hypothetical protein
VLSNSILQVPATTISLSGIGLTGDGKFVKFLGYNDLGQFEFSDSTFFGSQSVAQLGILLLQVSSGVTTFLTNSSGVITSPSVAAYDNFESTVIGVSTSVNIIPSASTLSVDNTAGTIKGISVNWGGANNDELQVSAHTPLSFFQVSPVDLTNANVLTATTIVDTTQYYNGSILVTLGVSSASIQRFIMTINGHFYLQYGEHEFSNLTDAVNSIDIATFTNILPNNSYVEICRVAVTKGASDLANTSQAVFRSIKTSTGGGPGNAPVWGSINGNINDQFDLATILATKYQGTGTTNTLPKIGIPGQLVNSNILDTGSLVNIASNLFVNGTIAVNTGLSTQFLKADGSIDSTTYVQGSGSIGNITKWSSLNGISDSNLFDSGTAISATTDMYINQIRVGRGQGNDDTNTIVGKATLSSNVSGGFNSALGRATLASNISGGSNVAIGYAVLNSANASENTGVGGSCLFSNIIGDKNTAIGSQALNPLTGGTGNIGIGYAAGFFRDGGNGNKNSSHSIFIGYNSRSFSAAQTNEIVIGDIGVGMGSNTTVIGNSSTTNARIFGALTADTISKVSGTASQFLMADGTVTEYKEYTAVINTAGTVITPAVLYNTIGSIVWSNIGTGRWQGVLSGAFLLNKCTFLANNGNGSALGIVNVFRIDDNTIRLQTYDLTGTPANDIINQGSLTIRVFP